LRQAAAGGTGARTDSAAGTQADAPSAPGDGDGDCDRTRRLTSDQRPAFVNPTHGLAGVPNCNLLSDL